jgi:hypothetical protein
MRESLFAVKALMSVSSQRLRPTLVWGNSRFSRVIKEGKHRASSRGYTVTRREVVDHWVDCRPATSIYLISARYFPRGCPQR